MASIYTQEQQAKIVNLAALEEYDKNIKTRIIDLEQVAISTTEPTNSNVVLWITPDEIGSAFEFATDDDITSIFE